MKPKIRIKGFNDASLQAMFPQKGETVPKIRFKGFEGEWEEVKLSSFAKRIKRRNSCMESTLALTIASALGLVSQNDYFNNSVVGANIRNYYLLKRGEFAYNKSYSNGYPFGSVKRLDRYEQGILSTLYIVFTIDDSISSDYLTHFFDTTLWHKDVAERAAEGARNHGLLNISAEDFLDIAIWKPRSIEEQQHIASYFTSLDKQIALQTQRLEKLRQIKAASLQAMFPQKGETVPKIRFKGFEGEWVITKAAEIFKTVNERNFSGLPVLSATQDKGMVTRESIGYNIFHDKANESTYKHIRPGQFVMHLRSFQGGFAHSAIEGICSPAYTIMEFKDKEENHDLYWKYVLASKHFIKSLEMITYGIRDGRTISFDEFKEMVFLVPKVEEQQHIASYFTSLDKQIALQTQRLEKLRQIKAACLDKMFV